MKKHILKGLLTGVAISSITIMQPALAGPKVVLADLNWPELKAIDAVLTLLLEQNFDADVSEIHAAQSAIFAGMAKGDGSVDVHPAVWSAAQSANIKKYVKNQGTVLLSKHPYMGNDGWYIPAYTSKKYNIKKVSDLLNSKIAKHFDLNHDGQPDYWPGAPGWGITDTYLVKAKSQGIAKVYQPLNVSGPMFKAQLKSAYRDKKAILFHYYVPSAVPYEYDLTKLKEPKFNGYAMESKKGSGEYNPDGCYNYYPRASGSDWLQKSSITCGTPPQPIYIGYSKALVKRAPKIANFLSNVQFNINEVNKWIYEIKVKNIPPKDVAQKWADANSKRIQAWVGN